MLKTQFVWCACEPGTALCWEECWEVAAGGDRAALQPPAGRPAAPVLPQHLLPPHSQPAEVQSSRWYIIFYKRYCWGRSRLGLMQWLRWWKQFRLQTPRSCMNNSLTSFPGYVVVTDQRMQGGQDGTASKVAAEHSKGGVCVLWGGEWEAGNCWEQV